MNKFYEEFYESRIEDWKNKYIKLLELRKLVKLIVKDIEKHGDKIERRNGRFSIIEDSRPSLIQLDRRSVGLSALEDKENLFNKNAKIFESPVMYEIENTFKEIENLTYSDDIKIFLYFLHVEIHNVYIFYLNKEKEIYNMTNEHLYKRKNMNKMSEKSVLEELNGLTEIAFLTYSFYLYVDMNIEAIHQILKYFDEHFIGLNDNISLNNLYFNKYLSQNESDLKYMLTFKIIIESTAFIESYRKELIKLFPHNSEIKSQGKELYDVLVYLISKNTDRVNEEIYEVYINSNNKGGIKKNKKNVDIDIQNSFFIDIHKADDYLKRLEEYQYDKKKNIVITSKNKINIIILFIYIFLNSIFYIIPYSSLYFNYKNVREENKEKQKCEVHFEYLGIILCSTHIGILLSRFIYSYFKKFKKAYIFYCFCFLLSFVFIISASFFNLKSCEDTKLFIHTGLISISRLFLGLSNERIITRKYLVLFIPESRMRYFSIYFLLNNYLGQIAGAILIYFIDKIPKILDNETNEFLLYIFGIGMSLILLIILFILFTEPNEDEDADMLKQILNISKVTDDNNDEEDVKVMEEERYRVDILGKKSINDNAKDEDVITFEENNREMKTEREEEDEKRLKLMEEKVISKDELEGLNSIEKDIIIMNEKSNFDDVNLVGNELERIKRNQINNNKAFRKSFISFILTLFLSNMINEYILIKTPFFLDNILNKNMKQNNWVVATAFILLLVFSFPLIVFFRILKKFEIGRRELLLVYIIVFIFLISIVIYRFINLDEKKPLLAIIFSTYLFNNCLEGITHLLIEKIIPSFVKFCGVNMKYLFSYSIHIGKAFGGIIFFLFYLFLYQKNILLNLDKFESIFFLGLTFIFLFISFIFYHSLRVRAITKLRFYQT